MNQPSTNIDNFLSSIEYIYDCRHCESKKTHYRRPIEKDTRSQLYKMKPPPVRKVDNSNNISLSSKKLSQEAKVNE